MKTLTGKQRRYLRSLSNRLKATVHVGKGGMTEPLLASLMEVLERHELVKLHINPNCEFSAKEMAQQLPATAKAHWVQTVGRSVVLYAPADPPEISLPKAD